MSLEGKVAIVTGGTRGIGRAVVTVLAQHGCKVAFTYLNSEKASQTLMEEWTGRVLALRHDVGDFSKTRGLIDTVCETFGSLDFVINNAGVLANKPLCIMKEEEWDVVIDTNLKGVFNITRAAIQPMMKKRRGRIVNIASVGGLQGMRGQTNYCASKAGVIGFTRALAREVATCNITVNAIAPGFIETDMISSIPKAYREQYLKLIPMGRFGTAENVSAVVMFLLSEDAQYITGQVITVDGGLTA